MQDIIQLSIEIKQTLFSGIDQEFIFEIAEDKNHKVRVGFVVIQRQCVP